MQKLLARTDGKCVGEGGGGIGRGRGSFHVRPRTEYRRVIADDIVWSRRQGVVCHPPDQFSHDDESVESIITASVATGMQVRLWEQTASGL